MNTPVIAAVDPGTISNQFIVQAFIQNAQGHVICKWEFNYANRLEVRSFASRAEKALRNGYSVTTQPV